MNNIEHHWYLLYAKYPQGYCNHYSSSSDNKLTNKWLQNCKESMCKAFDVNIDDMVICNVSYLGYMTCDEIFGTVE